MKERILEFLRVENKSSAQLAEEIGVQPSGISHIVSGRNNPSLDFVVKMLERYKYLSVDWLLFGTGEMYRDKNLQTLFDESLSSPNVDEKIAAASNNVIQVSEKKEFRAEGKRNELPQDKSTKDSDVVKIVWFYSNNSFEEYYPKK
jgi:transcriptional regulator with XRE-family HTH domain